MDKFQGNHHRNSTHNHRKQAWNQKTKMDLNRNMKAIDKRRALKAIKEQTHTACEGAENAKIAYREKNKEVKRI